MSYIVIDFETRSTIDLKKRGAFVYMSSAATEPMCLGALTPDQEPMLWIPEKFLSKIDRDNITYPIVSEQRMIDAVMNADYVVAQNSQFEFLMWNLIMVPRFGWPKLPLDRLHDTQAQCAYCALPMSLGYAGMALGLSTQKDSAGHKVMLKLCKPRRPRKAEREANPNWMFDTYWHEDPRDLETNFNYCGQDVLAEDALHRHLPDLPPKEREIWLLDQRINLRGVHIDKPNVEAIIQVINAQEKIQQERFAELTNGAVTGPRSFAALKLWINQETGLKVKSLNKAATIELIEQGDLPEHVRKVLEIKAQLSKSSVAKFNAMLDRMNDGRVQGWSAYHAAATGRWAAWGLQLHNNPRDCYAEEDYEIVTSLFREGSIEAMELLFDNPYYCASRCVRGAISAAPGKQFICTDFSAIEGRGLAHLAGEKWVVDAYRDGVDMYKMSASEIFGVPYEDINKEQRQVGKVAELALGYAGGIGAFATMATVYNVDLESLPDLILPHATIYEVDGPYGAIGLAKMYLAKNKGAMSQSAAQACDVIKRKWRDARQNIVRFWKQIENCAIQAVKDPGKVYMYRGIRFCTSNGFLKCRLPSGRLLHYFRPIIEMRKSPWDVEPEEGEEPELTQEVLTYTGLKIVEGRTTRQWASIDTYSGKICENICQGFCRDLLAEMMLRHEEAGYKIILHCHDEDMAEMPIGKGSLEDFNRIAEIVPSWAEGMPIKAEGWVGSRYQKG